MPNTHKCAGCKGTGMVGAASCEICRGTGSIKIVETEGLESTIEAITERAAPKAMKVRTLKLSAAGRKSAKGLSFTKR